MQRTATITKATDARNKIIKRQMNVTPKKATDEKKHLNGQIQKNIHTL